MQDDLTSPTERVAAAVYWLCTGQALTVAELAQRLQMSPRGARYLLNRAALVAPIYDENGVWRLAEPLDDARQL